MSSKSLVALIAVAGPGLALLGLLSALVSYHGACRIRKSSNSMGRSL